MVDEAPPPEAVLPDLGRLLRGRVLVAHSARFDLGVLRSAFARAALDWPEPPVLCTVAMARRLAPLQRRRGLASLADALGIDVEVTHRALPDAETCARVFCALFGRLTAHAATIGEAVALLGPKRGGGTRRPRAGARRRPPARAARTSPRSRATPASTCSATRDGHPLYVGKSVCLRTRARAHFTTPAAWTGEAEHVDYQATQSELGALLLEDRLIKALRPPGNKRGKRSPDGYVYLRCRLDIAFPILEVALEPARGHAVTVGPVRGRAAAAELVEQLNSLFGLRHCGRKLPRRDHPSAYGQMGRCLSPCLGDLDPNLYRERLDRGAAPVRRPARRRRRAARAPRRAARRGRGGAATSSAPPGCSAAASGSQALLRRLGGLLRATHAGTRLVLAPHPAKRGRFDAFWIAGGRVVDWGALPGDPDELVARTRCRAARHAAAGARRLAAGGRGRRDAAGRRLGRGARAAGASSSTSARSTTGRLARWIRTVESSA